MHLLLPQAEIEFYLTHLLASNFPLPSPLPLIPAQAHASALARLEYCFSHIKRKYYCDEHGPVFDPLNADHLCAYLWFLSNTLAYQFSNERLAIALSHLNKRLHGVDLFYSVQLPDIFLLVHPVGSVFGAASYSNFFVAYQNCTIGADGTSYPRLAEGVVCFSRTSVIGSCDIGSNVVLAANAFLLNTNVPPSSVVTGAYPSNRLIPNRQSTIVRVFSPSIS